MGSVDSAMAHDWRTPSELILRHFHCRGVDGFVVLWAHVAQSLVDPLAVIKLVDVLEHAHARFESIGEAGVVRPLVLERPEKPLHRRVVVAATSPTHRTGDAQRGQHLLIIIAGVLAAAIAAEQRRPDVVDKRRNFAIARRFVAPGNFVLLDESGTKTNTTRLPANKR